MAIAYVSTAGFTAGSGTSIAAFSKPATTAIGDVLIAQCYIESDAATLTIASTGDTWTLVPATGPATNTGSSPDTNLWVWICVVANDSSTIGVTWGGGSFWRDFAVHRFTGVDTTTPQDVTATKNTGSASTPTGTGLATGTAGRHLVLCTASFDGNARSAWTSPLVERDDSGNVAMGSGADAAGTDTANKEAQTGGPDATWAAVMLALRPAAATAAVTGTATASITEADIVAGGKTIITTLTGDTFIADTVPGAVFSSGTAATTTAAPGRASTGDIVATFPATPTVGQFGLVICYLDAGTASINSPGSPAQTWNLVTGAPWGTNTPKLYIWTRVMLTGDTAPTVTIAGAGVNDSSVVNVAFYNGIGSIVTIGAATSSTGTPSTAAQITGAATGNILVGIIARGDNESASGQTFGGSGTGVAERLDAGTDQGNDSQISMADKTLTGTGATGGLSVTTAATDPYIGIILELAVATISPYKVAAVNLWAPLLDSAQAEGTGWDATVKPALAAGDFVRTSATVTTITLPAVASYNVTAQETITDTVPGGILTAGTNIVATPTFTVDTGSTSPTVTGVAATATAAVSLPTITAGVQVAVTGVAATASAAVPLPSIQVARTVPAVAATATAAVSIPTVTSVQTATVTGVAATASAAASTPTVTAGVQVAAAGVPAEANAAISTPAITSVQIASVAAVPATATAAVPLPTVTAIEAVSATVSGVPAEASSAVSVPTVTAQRTVSVAAVPAEASADVGSPTVTAGVSVTVAGEVATSSASVSTPSVTAVQIASVSAVPAIADAEIPTVTVTVGAAGNVTVSAPTVESTAAVSTPIVTAGVQVSVAAVPAEATASVSTPTITAGVSATVSAVAADSTAAVSVPTVTGQVTTSVTGVAAEADAGVSTPTVTVEAAGNASVSGVPAEASASVPLPTVSAVQIVTVSAVAASTTAAVSTPTVTSQVAVSVSGVPAEASSAVSTPDVTSVQIASTTAVPATASAIVPAPTVTGLVVLSVTVTAVPASADAEALAPSLSGGVSVIVLAVVAEATSAAETPTLAAIQSVTVIAVPAEATATVLPPIRLQLGILIAASIAVVPVLSASLSSPAVLSQSGTETHPLLSGLVEVH
jgi:hypothetical protein